MTIIVFVIQICNREEKSLRHVAIVANFLDDNTKTSLKKWIRTVSKSSSYLILFTLSNVGEIFWVEPKRTVRKFRKRKTKLLCCAHLLHKAGAQN